MSSDALISFLTTELSAFPNVRNWWIVLKKSGVGRVQAAEDLC